MEKLNNTKLKKFQSMSDYTNKMRTLQAPFFAWGHQVILFLVFWHNTATRTPSTTRRNPHATC
ncbi:hypothetical protein PG991_003566 [Apiospora marii]|uniref:Uncharacterized protein n=1 Tax=Apiospora marii TaxID=335849 RepID=A0ABR1S3Q5_9PEZI